MRAALDGTRIVRDAFGVSGAIYLATIPLVLAAAVALRYLHVLAHVVSVVESAG